MSRSLPAALAVLMLVLTTLLRPGVARAEPEAANEPFASVDAFFGEWLVGPMYRALFWDLLFWDDELPAGEGIGQKVGDERVVGHDDRGYLLRTERSVSVLAGRRLLDTPIELRLGEVSLELSEAPGGGYLAQVAAGQVLPLEPCADALSCGTALGDAAVTRDQGRLVLTSPTLLTATVDAGLAERADLRVLEGRAPFPLLVEVVEGTLRTMAHEVALPVLVLPPRPGDRLEVAGQEGEWEVLSVEGHGMTVQSVQEQVRAEPLPDPEGRSLPLVVAWLVFGAIFFTFRMAFINLRGLGHAVAVTAGRYDEAGDPGDVSHFQALSAALSATVGLGNIAGVAIAVTVGGPGAIFWMIVAGFLGMSSKFVECTLGQMYRVVDRDGRISGGPMHYLDRGLAELGLGPLGKVLAVVFALMCIGGSLGGGNMFQANQSFAAVAEVVPVFAPKAQGTVVFERSALDGELRVPAGTVVSVAEGGPRFLTLEEAAFDAGQETAPPVGIRAVRAGVESNVGEGFITEAAFADQPLAVTNPGPTSGGAPVRGWLYGLLLSVAVGVVILGGIKSIGRVAGVIVPVMCGVYVLAGLYIILVNVDQLPWAISHIVTEAFTPEAGRGGLIGVLVQGFRRAAFSNEAGVGSASIAHSAAATHEPVREGVVALLEPFIDTIIVCTITGLVVVITGTYTMGASDGVLVTSAAFGSVLDWFPLVLTFAVVSFAYSTMISWSYYGERCATWLFGAWASLPYKLLFLVCVFFGSVFTLGNVLDFSDLMVLGMAFPNILGLLLLSGKVKRALDDYWGRLRAGQMPPRR